MLKTTVFVRKINNLSDARYCAGMGVTYLLFDLDKISEDEATEISGWLEGIEIVNEDSLPENLISLTRSDSLSSPEIQELLINESFNGISHECKNLDEFDHLAEILEELEVE